METKQQIEIIPEMAQALADAFQFYVDAILNTWNAIVEWMREFFQEVRKIFESLNRRQINQFRRGFFYAKMVDRGVPAWLARWISRLCPIQLIR